MREIKFRAWDKCNERMVEPRNILKICMSRLNQEPYLIVYLKKWMNENREIKESDKSYTNEFELMQYTGLKNHKGTEIYEGDIVHARGHYAGEGWFDTGEHEYNFKDEVKWDNDKLAFVCDGYYLHEINIIKIVGNRHQNPELLKE